MNELLHDIAKTYGQKAAQSVKGVCTVLRAKIIARDLFGWRTFIDDVLLDTATYMLTSNFKYSGGAYVACGMQAALDKCKWCNAQKRRGDYELVSLDEFFQVADEPQEDTSHADSLVLDIELKFGKSLALELEPFVRGYTDKLSKAVLDKIRKPEFVEWLRKYME